jgi:hypothetical protein
MKVKFKLKGTYAENFSTSIWFRITINGRVVLNQLGRNNYIYFVNRMKRYEN